MCFGMCVVTSVWGTSTVSATLRSPASEQSSVIASIEDPEFIERILAHRRERGTQASVSSLGPRAPPQSSPF